MFDNPLSRTQDMIECICRLASSLSGHAPAEVREEVLLDAFRSARDLQRQVDRQNERIAQLERLASSDPLTGLLNRRGFEIELSKALAGARRYREIGVLIYIDLDKFKPINDTYGHAAGDKVLCTVATTLCDNTRRLDTVARLGGDEFAVLLARTDWEVGLAKAEELSRILNQMEVTWHSSQIPICASMGFQGYHANSNAEELLHGADSAMYAAKAMRNQCEGTSVAAE